MASSQVKEQILKAILRKIGFLPNKNVSLREVMIGFDHIRRDVFFDAVSDLVNEKMLSDSGHGYVALTPDGWGNATLLMNPPPTENQNTVNFDHTEIPPVQQGINAHQTQRTVYRMPSNDDLQYLVELMTKNLGELKLSLGDARKAKAQLATIQAQLLDTPNPIIIKEAGCSLKNVTEGAIGSLLATAAPPRLWAGVQALLALL